MKPIYERRRKLLALPEPIVVIGAGKNTSKIVQISIPVCSFSIDLHLSFQHIEAVETRIAELGLACQFLNSYDIDYV